MATDSKTVASQSLQDIDALLNTLVEAGGEVFGFCLSDDPIINDARALGLVEIHLGGGSRIFDTVRLAPSLRSKSGPRPLVE